MLTVKKTDTPLVIVRTYSAGVHVGHLAERDGREVLLRNAVRVWSWTGANTLHELALDGPGEGSRISRSVPEILLTEAIEVIPVAEGARVFAGWSK